MTEDHFKHIYQHEAAKYQELIAFEDVEGNLIPTLAGITPFDGKAVLDLGSGTGRIPQLFPQNAITCLDLHLAMLRESRRQRHLRGGAWKLLQGDGRCVPFPANTFDVITAGWAFGHFTGWYPQTWRGEVDRVLAEAHRVCRPDGTIIILETLTTGALDPAPPTPALGAYYQHLEQTHKFSRLVVQTDYLFDDLEQACRCAGFFFGEGLAQKVRAHGWVRLPEWTGVWHKQV